MPVVVWQFARAKWRRVQIPVVRRRVLDAVQRWANDDLRSLNAQIEFVLRKVLKQEGRLPERADRGSDRSGKDRSGRG